MLSVAKQQSAEKPCQINNKKIKALCNQHYRNVSFPGDEVKLHVGDSKAMGKVAWFEKIENSGSSEINRLVEKTLINAIENLPENFVATFIERGSLKGVLVFQKLPKGANPAEKTDKPLPTYQINTVNILALCDQDFKNVSFDDNDVRLFIGDTVIGKVAWFDKITSSSSVEIRDLAEKTLLKTIENLPENFTATFIERGNLKGVLVFENVSPLFEAEKPL